MSTDFRGRGAARRAVERRRWDERSGGEGWNGGRRREEGRSEAVRRRWDLNRRASDEAICSGKVKESRKIIVGIRIFELD